MPPPPRRSRVDIRSKWIHLDWREDGGQDISGRACIPLISLSSSPSCVPLANGMMRLEQNGICGHLFFVSFPLSSPCLIPSLCPSFLLVLLLLVYPVFFLYTSLICIDHIYMLWFCMNPPETVTISCCHSYNWDQSLKLKLCIEMFSKQKKSRMLA